MTPAQIQRDAAILAARSARSGDAVDGFRTMIKFNVILMFILLGLVGFLIVERLIAKDPTYFAMSSDGRIVRLAPLNEPFLNQTALFNFCDEAMGKSFTLDFKNYRQQTNDAETYYSPQGYRSYKSVLETQQLLSRIIKEFRVSSIVRHGAWVVLDAKSVNGIYFWRVEAPVFMTLSGKDGDVPFEAILVFDLARASNVDNPRGVVVNAFRFAEKKN